MSDEHLATYLNDHLAGSVAAFELLEVLTAAHTGTDLGPFFAELRWDVFEDRQELESVMAVLKIAESPVRKTAGWLGQRATELKLMLDDPAGGTLRLFESLEILSLGLAGKLGLWRALAAAAEAEDGSGLAQFDYHRLIQRAEDQCSRVEPQRLEAARAALA